MTSAAILLLLASALLHASWNLASKRAVPSRSFFLLSDSAAALCLLPALVWFSPRFGEIPPLVWPLAAIAGGFQALYYSGLAAAYRTGDLSVVYPLARCTSAGLTACIMILLGKAHEITALGFAGIVLIVAGSLLLPRRKLLGPGLARGASAAILWALLAAAATAGYSIVDDAALERFIGAGVFPYASAILIYGTVEVIATVTALAVSLALKGGLGEIPALLRERKLVIVFTGLATYTGYLLVLAAMPLVTNVSYVVGFRQLSIPLGVLAGILILKEPAPVPRILGTALMLAGVLLLAVG